GCRRRRGRRPDFGRDAPGKRCLRRSCTGGAGTMRMLRLMEQASPRRARLGLRSLILPLMLVGLSACGTLGIGGSKDEAATPTIGNRSPILSRIASEVTADPTLANVAVVLPPPQTNVDWPQAGGNAAKAPGHATLSATPTRIWTATIQGSNPRRRLASAPVVGGGALFVVDTAGDVHAFDAATGARRWTHRIEVERAMRDSTFGGGVSFAEGRVYATNGAGDVVALDAQTGSEVWRVRPAGPLRGAPTIAFNTVYVMTQDNQIHALSAQDGSLVWQEVAAGGQSGVFGVAAPAAGQGTV